MSKKLKTFHENISNKNRTEHIYRYSNIIAFSLSGAWEINDSVRCKFERRCLTEHCLCSECNMSYNGRDKYWAQHEVNMPAGGGSVDRAPDFAKDKREFETGKAQIFFYHTCIMELCVPLLQYSESSMFSIPR